MNRGTPWDRIFGCLLLRQFGRSVVQMTPIEKATCCLFLCALSPRLLIIPVVLAYLLTRPSSWSRYFVTAIAIAAILSPVDVAIPNWPGPLRGNPNSGIRCVPVVSGMPAHTGLRARYGEYITTGCSGLTCLYQPQWAIVWWPTTERDVSALPIGTSVQRCANTPSE